MTTLILNIFVTLALAAPKKSEPATVDLTSTRDLAAQEVTLALTTSGSTAKSQSKLASAPEDNSTPSVMLPLHDPYIPFSNRNWKWVAGFGLSSQKILVTKPGLALGRQDLSELGSLPFLNLSAGIERSQSWGDWGVSLLGATTLKSETTITPTGKQLSTNIQWVSYGAELNLGRRWNHWLGTSAALQTELVTVAQTSSQSDLARWSQNFTSTNTRLSLDNYVSASQLFTLSLIDKNSNFGRNLVWSLNYGVKW